MGCKKMKRELKIGLFVFITFFSVLFVILAWYGNSKDTLMAYLISGVVVLIIIGLMYIAEKIF